MYAHRAAWMLFKGEIPKHKPHVLHHCDNPQCIRWTGKKHLWVGTNQDNIDDKLLKKRQSHGRRHALAIGIGEAHPRAIISDAHASNIRRKYFATSHTYNSIAMLEGVSLSCIRDIVKQQGRFDKDTK